MKTIFILPLLLTVFGAVTQNRFVYLNPGFNNCISVSPLTPTQAASYSSFIGRDSGYTYKWRNLPTWATAIGSSFFGTPPGGITGTTPVSVDYSDGRGSSGSFTFTVNYGGTSNAQNTLGGLGALNIVSGASTLGSVPSGQNAQLVLIPQQSVTGLSGTISGLTGS